MGQAVKNQTRFCQLPQDSKKELNRNLNSRRIIMAVGFSFILTTSLLYYLMLPPALPPVLLPTLPTPQQLTPHGAIAIDGHANFSDTALLEGWPGDGSPENPFIIDALEIDLGEEDGPCIIISNIRVSFTISNCNLTGNDGLDFGPSGVGILLENVTNGELVNNSCSSIGIGIAISRSEFITVSNNICANDVFGISIYISNSNMVISNTCFNNTSYGIRLSQSKSNTVVNNTCNNNTIGIYLYESYSNTVASNACFNNTCYEIFENSESKESVLLWIWYIGFMGFIGITSLGGVWIMDKRVSSEE